MDVDPRISVLFRSFMKRDYLASLHRHPFHHLPCGAWCRRNPGVCQRDCTAYAFNVSGRGLPVEGVCIGVPLCRGVRGSLTDAGRAVGLMFGRAVVSERQLEDWFGVETRRIRFPAIYSHDIPTSCLFFLRDAARLRDPRVLCCVCGRFGRLGRDGFRMIGVADMHHSLVRLITQYSGLGFFSETHKVICGAADCKTMIRCLRRGPFAGLFREVARHHQHVRETKKCQQQLKALRKFLKTGDREALTSLPKEYGPRGTSRA